MVGCPQLTPAILQQLPVLLAQTAEKPPILQMPASQRAKVMAVISGLIILGFALMLLAWMGARMTKRYMNRGVDQSVLSEAPLLKDAWAQRPLNRRDASESDLGNANEPDT